MRPAAVDIGPDQVSVGLEVPRFHTASVVGFNVTDRQVVDGSIHTTRWTDEQIADYHQQAHRHELIGRPAVLVARQVEREIKGGLVGRLLAKLNAPTTPPQDRSYIVANCGVFGYPGIAFRVQGSHATATDLKVGS